MPDETRARDLVEVADDGQAGRGGTLWVCGARLAIGPLLFVAPVASQRGGRRKLPRRQGWRRSGAKGRTPPCA
ncbi:hypothetical protein AB5I41_31870 [Sphingomonas sp. MMS24-JH45]